MSCGNLNAQRAVYDVQSDDALHVYKLLRIENVEHYTQRDNAEKWYSLPKKMYILL